MQHRSVSHRPASHPRRHGRSRPQLVTLEDRSLPGDILLGILATQLGIALADPPGPVGSLDASQSVPAQIASLVPGDSVVSPATPSYAGGFGGEIILLPEAGRDGLSGGGKGVFQSDPLAGNAPADLASLTAALSANPFGLRSAHTSSSHAGVSPDRGSPVVNAPSSSAHGLGGAVVPVPASVGPTPSAGSSLPRFFNLPPGGNPTRTVADHRAVPSTPATHLPFTKSLPGGAASPDVANEWPTYQHDVSHTGSTPASVDPTALTLAWRAPQGYSVPLVVGDSAISMRNQQGVGSDMTTVSSFGLTDGAVNWTYTNRFVFPSQPTAAEGLVVFAATEFPPNNPFNLYVLDAGTGTLDYTVQLSSGFNSSVMPTVSRNPITGDLTAYVASGGGLYAVSLGDTSGSVLWTASGSFGGFSMPTVVGNSVVLAGPGQYYAFDQTTGAANHFQAGGISGGGGTTVAYDAALSQFYVLEDYNSTVGTLTAYNYIDNDTITQLWQKTGPGISGGSSVAIGPDSLLYAADNSTLLEIDPSDGSTLRSLDGQSIAGRVTPAMSNGYLWAFSQTQTLVYSLDTFTLTQSLPGSRGSLNSAYDSPGALADGYFLLDYGNIYGSPGFDVYATP
jgi:hypothetical protein